jgi:hypothetical protein
VKLAHQDSAALVSDRSVSLEAISLLRAEYGGKQRGRVCSLPVPFDASNARSDASPSPKMTNFYS